MARWKPTTLVLGQLLQRILRVVVGQIKPPMRALAPVRAICDTPTMARPIALTCLKLRFRMMAVQHLPLPKLIFRLVSRTKRPCSRLRAALWLMPKAIAQRRLTPLWQSLIPMTPTSSRPPSPSAAVISPARMCWPSAMPTASPGLGTAVTVY